MVSDLEKLTKGLRSTNVPQNDVASRLARKIQTDPVIQQELSTNGSSRVMGDDGKVYIVRRNS